MKDFARKIPAVLGLILICGASARAVPSFFTYQGRYLNAGLPSNGSALLEFRVTSGGAVGCGQAANPGVNGIYWTSGSTNVFTVNGLFSYKIGYRQDGVTPDPSFTLNWGAGAYYLDVCANGVELVPPDLIGSTPYALFASSAGYAAVVGGALFASTNTWSAPQIFDAEVVIATEAYFSSGRLNLGGNPIVNVAAPVNPGDGANKSYVDVATAAAVSAATNTVAATGGAALESHYHDFTASQTFTDEVVIATEAYFPSGRLNMGGNSIVNVAAPVNPGDAANKSYVDVATAAAVAGLSPQIVYLTYPSFTSSNYTLTSSTSNIDVIVNLSGDATGGHALTVTPLAATIGQEIKVIVVSGAASGTDTISISASTNGGFPSCVISMLAGTGGPSSGSAWLGLIGYSTGGGGNVWACFNQ